MTLQPVSLAKTVVLPMALKDEYDRFKTTKGT